MNYYVLLQNKPTTPKTMKNMREKAGQTCSKAKEVRNLCSISVSTVGSAELTEISISRCWCLGEHKKDQLNIHFYNIIDNSSKITMLPPFRFLNCKV